MKFKNHQFFSVVNRNTRDAVAAIQIKKLAERSGYRETPSQRIRHRISGKQSKPGFTAAMRLCKRIKQKRRIVILCKYAVIIWHTVFQNRIFIHMIASCRIQIHFLDQCKIRIIKCNQISGSLNCLKNAVFTLCPGRFPAIHKEAEVRSICSKTNVVCKRRILFACCKFRICLLHAGLHLKRQIVFDSMIARIKINKICKKYNYKNANDDTNDLKKFFRCFHGFILVSSLSTEMYM